MECPGDPAGVLKGREEEVSFLVGVGGEEFLGEGIAIVQEMQYLERLGQQKENVLSFLF